MDCKFSFAKHSRTYAAHSRVQREVARILVEKSLDSSIKSILDLGAGSGNVAKNVSHFAKMHDFIVDSFTGVDISRSMLEFHPRHLPHIKHISIENADFELYTCQKCVDMIISSSAIQWARNLESLLQKIQHFSLQHRRLHSCVPKFACSIFTDKSLESLHEFLGTRSPLDSRDSILKLLHTYFCGESWIMREIESFSNPRSALQSLRENGILGGGKIPFSLKKKLKCEWNLQELEYEIVCFVGTYKGS